MPSETREALQRHCSDCDHCEYSIRTTGDSPESEAKGGSCACSHSEKDWSQTDRTFLSHSLKFESLTASASVIAVNRSLSWPPVNGRVDNHKVSCIFCTFLLY